MLKKLVYKVAPDRLRKAVRKVVRRELQLDLTKVPFHRSFFPHAPDSESYFVPRVPEGAERHPVSPLPIPPSDLRLYGRSVEEWLSLSDEHVGIMRDVLGRNGVPPESAGRILDLGCADGRMIRGFHDLSSICEIWGVDVSASHILWCKQYMNPPFHFATTTLFPHLPFEDRYFGLIYAGSVFTHIEDLTDAWFQELRRILRPGGMLYITIHDRGSIDLLENWQHTVLRAFRRWPDYDRYSRADFGMFTVGRHQNSQVFYDHGYLLKYLDPFFRVREVVEQAYSYQTAILLERL